MTTLSARGPPSAFSPAAQSML